MVRLGNLHAVSMGFCLIIAQIHVVSSSEQFRRCSCICMNSDFQTRICTHSQECKYYKLVAAGACLRVLYPWRQRDTLSMVAMELGTVRVIACCGPTAPVFRDNGASHRLRNALICRKSAARGALLDLPRDVVLGCRRARARSAVAPRPTHSKPDR